MLKHREKNNNKKGRKENKERKKSTIQKGKGVTKSFQIWYEPMTTSFGIRAAYHFTTDNHKSFARLSIYNSSMQLLIRLQTVSPLKLHTCLD